MSYYDEKNGEFKVAALAHDEYPCLPIYELFEDESIGKEINNHVKKIYLEKKTYQKKINELLEIIQNLEKENNDFCKENGELKEKINKLRKLMHLKK